MPVTLMLGKMTLFLLRQATSKETSHHTQCNQPGSARGYGWKTPSSQLSWRSSKPQKNAVGCNGRGHTHGKAAFNGNVNSKPQMAGVSGNLHKGQTGMDRPDLVNRVFKMKLRSLLADLKSNLFGKIHYMLYVIEYHGRGCVHAHIIIKFEGPSPEQLKEVDKWIWTNLPDASIKKDELRK